MLVRKTVGGTSVTWAFIKGTPEARHLCLECTNFDGQYCPRGRLTAWQKSELTATRCIFRNLEVINR